MSGIKGLDQPQHPSPLGAASGMLVCLFLQIGCGGSSSPQQVSFVPVSSTSTPSLIPNHILTSDYLFSLHGHSAADYAPWLSWAEVNTATASALTAAGIQTMIYTNPNRQSPGDPLYTSDESTFAHTCSGARIASASDPNLLLMDPHSANLAFLWSAFITSNRTTASFYAVFDDAADDLYGISALPCGFSSSDWLNATNAQIKSLGVPVVYNALGVINAGDPVSPAIALNESSIGGMMEDCYVSRFNPHQISGVHWQIVENTEIAMAQQGKLFFCYASNLSDAASAIDLRIFTYSSFMLTYDLQTSLLWEYFVTPSGFHVEPEAGLVAVNPSVSHPTTISSLQQSGGAYGREYASCYNAGKALGRCAFVVNPDLATEPFPFAGYHHTLVLSGGGIFDGGTMATNGPEPPTIVAPKSAVVVFE